METKEMFCWQFDLSAEITQSDILLKTNVTAVAIESCNATFLELNQRVLDRRLQNGLIAGQMCAYDPDAQNDACQVIAQGICGPAGMF